MSHPSCLTAKRSAVQAPTLIAKFVCFCFFVVFCFCFFSVCLAFQLAFCSNRITSSDYTGVCKCKWLFALCVTLWLASTFSLTTMTVGIVREQTNEWINKGLTVELRICSSPPFCVSPTSCPPVCCTVVCTVCIPCAFFFFSFSSFLLFWCKLPVISSGLIVFRLFFKHWLSILSNFLTNS